MRNDQAKPNAVLRDLGVCEMNNPIFTPLKISMICPACRFSAYKINPAWGHCKHCSDTCRNPMPFTELWGFCDFDNWVLL